MQNEDDIVPQNDYYNKCDERVTWQHDFMANNLQSSSISNSSSGFSKYDGDVFETSVDLLNIPPQYSVKEQTTSGFIEFDNTVTHFKPVEEKEVSYKLLIIRQPEQQHRARYLSEGSRGAIKDRSGSSNCTIQLVGYHRPTRVHLFAVTGNEDGSSLTIIPHPLYRLISVSGKTTNSSPCQKLTREDGVECLEITLYPENNMTAVLDCIGILKICTYDTKHRKRKLQNSTSGSSFYSAQSQNSVRILMRAYIPKESNNGTQVVQAITDPISCVQQLGVPEVLKMSLNRAPAKGGDELFIIGRNFDRNTKVLFREYKEDGTLKWNAEAFIDKQYLHQCHIVCTIPPYFNARQGGSVSVTVVCSSKSSYPRNFVYIPCDEDDDWRPPGSPQLEINNSFCLPDYEVDNHRDFLLLERNCCPSTFYCTSSKTNSIPPESNCDQPQNDNAERFKGYGKMHEYHVPTSSGHSSDL